MITLKQIKAVQTVEDLQNLGIGQVIVDISHRGGGLGFYGTDIVNHFNIPDYAVGRKFGAACNYLGGGVRGSIFFGGFGDKHVGNQRIVKLLYALGDATVRAYQNLENEAGMNDEQDQDGDTNWDAIATNSVRKAGGPQARSAY